MVILSIYKKIFVIVYLLHLFSAFFFGESIVKKHYQKIIKKKRAVSHFRQDVAANWSQVVCWRILCS
jgi:hypothetical protein